MALGLGLAAVNYQHWAGCREFASSLREQAGKDRVWIDADWGLRYYFESEGGVALQHEQASAPG